MDNAVAGAKREAADRSLWRYQPLVPVAAAFTGGVALDRHVQIATTAWLALTAALLAIWCVAFGMELRRTRGDDPSARGWLASVILMLVVAAVAGSWHHVYWHVYPANDIGRWCDRQAHPVRVRGVFVEEPLIVRAGRHDPLRAFPERTRSLCQLEVHEIEQASGWAPASGTAHLVVNGEVSASHAGDSVEVVGEVIAPRRAANPGEFDYAEYLRGRRTQALIHCDEPEAVRASPRRYGTNFSRWFERIAGAYERRLIERLPSGQAEIAVALLLGRYELLEEDVTERYMRTGTMHILAISGQHLAVLAGFLWFVLRFVPIPRKWGAVMLAVIVVAYALLTGARPPVLRAAVLVCVLVGAIVLDARSRRANPLALALIIVLAVNPSDLFDRGLQLSFLAVAALSWIVDPTLKWLKREPDPVGQLLEETRPWWRRTAAGAGKFVAVAFVMSAVVWLANVPLLAARFHLFSPIVVPLTVVMTPLATIALITGLAFVLIDPWAPQFVGSALAKLCGYGITAMDWCVQRGEGIPLGYSFVPGPPNWWVAGFYVSVLGILLFRPKGAARWRWATIGIAWLALGFAVPAIRAAPDRLECQILAVGNGSAAVLRTPGGRTILVDAGQIAGPRVGSRLIAPALWEAGITRLDAVFISHSDVDHFNGVPHLIERFSIGAVFVPPHFAHSDHAGVRLVFDELGRRGVPIRVSFDGDQFDLGGGVTARALHPPAEFGGTDNEQSLVLVLEYLGRRIMFPGDLEGAGLRRLLESDRLPIDVLVAPHHGSRRANPPKLVDWARPKLVVVSQGKPRSGATLDAFRDAGVPVITTNERGSVSFQIDSRGVHVMTAM